MFIIISRIVGFEAILSTFLIFESIFRETRGSICGRNHFLSLKFLMIENTKIGDALCKQYHSARSPFDVRMAI